MTSPFASLLELQRLDTDIHRHRTRLGALEAATDADVLAARASADERRQRAEQALTAARSEQARLEKELAELERRAEVAESRVSTLSDAHQIEVAQSEVSTLRGHASDVEEQTITAMEAVSEAESELDEATRAAQQAAEAERVAQEDRAGDIDENRAALEAAELARPAVEAAVPADALALYERLRVKGVNPAAAPFEGGRCGGCHLTLPATEIDHIRHAPADELLQCSDCSCILVRPSPVAAEGPVDEDA